jgi:sortase A
MRQWRTSWRAFALVALFAATACSNGPEDDPALLGVGLDQVAPTTTAAPAAVEPTIAPTTAPTTGPTIAPATLPASTAPATVVETLPKPVPPPNPDIDEPYLEIGTIEIPKLGIAVPLLEGITLTTLDRGPGHRPGTPMPGQRGNAVVAGHRTRRGRVFRDIDDLVPGDEVIFTTAEGRFRYLVTGTTIVMPDALYIIEQTETPTATLFACHPPGSTRQRIVVQLALDA